MNNKIIKSGLLLLFCSLIFAAAIFYSFYHAPQTSRIGKVVFSKTVEQGLKLNKITVNTAKSVTTLILKNNFWVVQEADDYYAGLSLMNSLFNSMNRSRFYSSQPATPELLSLYGLDNPLDPNAVKPGVLIQTFADNLSLNQIIIGNATENRLYTYAHIPGEKEIWLISNEFRLPQLLYSWFQQPLLNYLPQMIRSFSWKTPDTPEKSFVRDQPKQDFIGIDGKKYRLRLFSDQFTYLTFRDAAREEDFDLKAFPEHKSLQIVNFNTLITNIDFYTDQQQYWIKVKISAPNLKTFAIDTYIKDNNFLYDGWYFQLSPEIGRFLYNSLV